MKKALQNKVFCFIAMLLSVISGIMIGKIVNFPYVKFDQNINIVDVASIIATFIVAYIISMVIEKNTQNYRTEKDLLIKRLEDIYHLLDATNDELSQKTISYPRAAAHIKRIRTTFKCICELLCKTQMEIKDINQNKIKNELSELKDLITNSPVIDRRKINKCNLSITVKDNIICLSEMQYTAIEAKFELLKNELLHLQLEINRA